MTSSSRTSKLPTGNATPTPSPPRTKSAGLLTSLRLDTYSGLYLAVILVLVFTVLLPDTFGTASNARVIASSASISGILTLGVAVSMAAGMFDISLAANMTFSIGLLGALLTKTDLPWPVAVLLTVAAGALIGMVNAAIIIRLGVQPIVATLGMSSVLAAGVFWVADGKSALLDKVPASFTDAGTATIATIPITVYYLAAVALVLWFVLEHTPFGRYLYAVGSNAQAAKLAGVKVVRVQAISLMIAGTLAAVAGVVLTMQLGSASFGAGAAYLLPAFAATFLGSTQVIPGRFNVRGTIVALYLLAIAVKGLELQLPDLPWIKDLVEGLVLIVAVGITARAIRQRGTR
ncbi:ABC transporter permease [Amycolatopsis sp. GM8]|uniref:ABC transporter permease n=1 Tax=Amycolatopsis sp. GM8 TaxID=2896530 RepID=UPI001F4729F1|nr:ABC transporter permease [Amycolatopsis sp. GM8]